MEYTAGLQLFLGLVSGLVANAIWYYFNFFYDARRNPKAFGKYRHPLAEIFEHYHHATILTILGFRFNQPFLLGFSAALFLDEGIGQQHKFALGSGHFRESLCLELIILSVWVLLELLASVLIGA